MSSHSIGRQAVMVPSHRLSGLVPMLPLLFSFILSIAPLPPESNTQDPPQDPVQLAVDNLEAAFKRQSATALVEALASSGRVGDTRVLVAALRALRDKAPEVRLAAIEALRFNPHRGALRLLHNELNRHGNTTDETAALIRAVCQKGQAGSLPILSSKKIDTQSRVTASAWILGMGRLRHRDSMMMLLGFMQGLPKHRRVAHMDEFRSSLMLLSGVDHGMDGAAWMHWWEKNGDEAQVTTEVPAVPGLIKQEWCDYWDIGPDESHPEQFDVGPLPKPQEAPQEKSREKTSKPNRKNQGEKTGAGNGAKAGAKAGGKNGARAGAKAKGRNTDAAASRDSAQRPAEEADAKAAAKAAAGKGAGKTDNGKTGGKGGGKTNAGKGANGKTAGKKGDQEAGGKGGAKTAAGKGANKKAQNEKKQGKKKKNAKAGSTAGSGQHG